jgi:hypothetical protein
MPHRSHARLSLAGLALALAAAACDGDIPRGGNTTPPPAPAPPRLLVPGEARLAGLGVRACSRDLPGAPAGRRWCAFHRGTELWVFDLTRAMAGEPVPCDGTSPSCLRLTDRLFTGFRIQSPSHPEAHRFDGDTLFYLAEEHPAAAKLEWYEGYVWAWRPGWKQGRALTSDRGVFCQGSDRAPVAYCGDRVNDRPRTFDLRAGRLVDREDSLLPVIERITALHEGELAWAAAITPGGDLVYSSRREGDLTETLRLVTLGAAGPSTAVVSIPDVWGWILSRDGGHVFFLRDRRRNGPATLWGAAFPSGEGAAAVAPGVFGYEAIGPSGISYLTDLVGNEGTLHSVPDRRKPDTRFVIAADAHAWYPLGDGRYSYILQSDRNGDHGLIADNTTGTTAGLGDAEHPVFAAGMLADGAITWTEPAEMSGDLDTTVLGRPDGGRIMVVGAGVEFLESAGADVLVYGARRLPDVGVLDIHRRELPGGDAAAPEAQLVLPAVEPSNVTLVRGPPHVLLMGTADGAPEGRGLYGYAVPPSRPTR